MFAEDEQKKFVSALERAYRDRNVSVFLGRKEKLVHLPLWAYF